MTKTGRDKSNVVATYTGFAATCNSVSVFRRARNFNDLIPDSLMQQTFTFGCINYIHSTSLGRYFVLFGHTNSSGIHTRNSDVKCLRAAERRTVCEPSFTDPD